MKSVLKTIAIVIPIILGSCMPKNAEETAKNETTQQDSVKVIPVRTKPIATENVARSLDYTANLMAYKEIHYAPASPGRINKINVEVGNRVSKGQVLVEMDRTQLNQAWTQYENAKQTYQRIDTLYQLGSISEQQYESAKTGYEVAKTQYLFLKENTDLVSPINGIVTGKYFENGELFSAVPNTSAGKAAVVSLMQIDPLKANVNITQSYYHQIKPGMIAMFYSDLFPDRTFSGTISKVDPTIDAATRSFKTEIIVNNPDEKLRPGMFARIVIQLKEENALVVPAIAVMKQEGTNNRYVFVNDNGKARQIDVLIGKRYDDKIELISDELQEGTPIIVEGQGKLLNGSEIEVVNE